VDPLLNDIRGKIVEANTRKRMELFDKHGEYYFLSMIGVRPERQSEGLGGLLLREITKRADAEGKCCYLAGTGERSRGLYLRHGFVDDDYLVWHHDSIPGKHEFFYMLRLPQK